MDLTISERIKLIAKRKGVKLGDIAEAFGYSRQNLNQRMRRNAWDENDLKAIANVLGCELEIVFIDKETGERF